MYTETQFFFILDVPISFRNKTKRTVDHNFYTGTELFVVLKGSFKLDNMLPPHTHQFLITVL